MAKKKTRVKAPGRKSPPKSSSKSTLGTLTHCAVALHLSDRRIQQLVREEGLPKSAHGRYDVRRCLRWYVRYLHKKLRDAALPDPEGGHTASIAMRH